MKPTSLLLFVGLAACAPIQPREPARYPSVAPRSAQGVERATEVAVRLGNYEAAAARLRHVGLASTRAHEQLVELCDDYGARPAGSPALEEAIRWAAAQLSAAGHDAVRVEKVMIPHWVRGEASLALVEPRAQPLAALAIGGSVGTPPGGIRAEVVVVHDRKELEALGEGARGKVVLFDVEMPAYDEATHDPGYGSVLWTRAQGASLAAALGAKAVLVRSLTGHSLGTNHTGGLRYDPGQPAIPALTVTTEHASFLGRLAARGKRVVVQLSSSSRDAGLVESGNVVAELKGRERPDEVVVIGGHIDSWDLGQGAHDDGAGVVIAMEALALLRREGLVPRRTIRLVLFTNEENGLKGAEAYDVAHGAERHVAAIETDTGGTAVVALGVDMEDDAQEPLVSGELEPVARLLEPLAADHVLMGHAGADIMPLRRRGVATFGLIHDLSHYFDFHHSEADTVDKVSASDLAQSAVALATVAYVLADLETPIGRPAASTP